MSPLDLFGFQPFFNTYVYPILVHPLTTFALLVIVLVALAYDYWMHVAVNERLNRVMLSLADYVRGTQSILDLVFTPKGKQDIEALGKVIDFLREKAAKLPQPLEKTPEANP